MFAAVVLGSVVKGLDWMAVLDPSLWGLSLDMAEPQSVRKAPLHKELGIESGPRRESST